MNERLTVETLKQVKKVLDKYSVDYWLDCGTLLGAVRNGKIIPWDNDIDLGMLETQFPKIHAVSKELRDKGFNVNIWEWEGRVSISTEKCGIDVYIYKLSDTKATMMWLVQVYKKSMRGYIFDYIHRIISDQRRVSENSHMPKVFTKILNKIINILPSDLRLRIADNIWLSYEKTGCVIHLAIPREFFNNLSKIKFYGMEFKVPSKTEEYLSYRYGKNWRIPKKDYIHYLDDGAIVK